MRRLCSTPLQQLPNWARRKLFQMSDQEQEIKKLTAETGMSRAEAIVRIARQIASQDGESEENPNLAEPAPEPAPATSLEE